MDYSQWADVSTIAANVTVVGSFLIALTNGLPKLERIADASEKAAQATESAAALTRVEKSRWDQDRVRLIYQSFQTWRDRRETVPEQAFAGRYFSLLDALLYEAELVGDQELNHWYQLTHKWLREDYDLVKYAHAQVFLSKSLPEVVAEVLRAQ